MAPKISLIVPVFNVEKYVSKCLDSLVAQTLKDIEIICVDDCSTDNSLQIIEKYASKDSRIEIVVLAIHLENIFGLLIVMIMLI